MSKKKKLFQHINEYHVITKITYKQIYNKTKNDNKFKNY